ncbi:MAG: hypothetical protein ACYTG0_26240 [Planctomycetota bacterium]|jgi:hypothetical protein
MTDETHPENEPRHPRDNRPDETPVEPGRFETPEPLRPMERRLKAVRLRHPQLDPSELDQLSAAPVEAVGQDVRPRVDRITKRATSWTTLGAAWSFGVVVGAVAMLALVNLRSAATPSTIQPRDATQAAESSLPDGAANKGTGASAKQPLADRPRRDKAGAVEPADALPVQDGRAVAWSPRSLVVGGRRPVSRVAWHASALFPHDVGYPMLDEAILWKPSPEPSDSQGTWAWPRRDVYRMIDRGRAAEELFGAS